MLSITSTNARNNHQYALRATPSRPTATPNLLFGPLPQNGKPLPIRTIDKMWDILPTELLAEIVEHLLDLSDVQPVATKRQRIQQLRALSAKGARTRAIILDRAKAQLRALQVRFEGVMEGLLPLSERMAANLLELQGIAARGNRHEERVHAWALMQDMERMNMRRTRLHEAMRPVVFETYWLQNLVVACAHGEGMV